MKEHKALQEEPDREVGQEENQEEYSFMQEVIKDETDSVKKVKSNIFRIIGYGVVFGVAASVVFCALTPWLEAHFHNNPTQVEIPSDEEEQEPEEKPEKEEKQELDADSYRQVLQSLSITATKTKYSMATVSRKKNSSDESNKTNEGISGVVIADNGKELLILSQIVKTKKDESIQIAFFDKKSYDAILKMQDENLGIGVYAVEKKDIDTNMWKKITIAELGNSHLMESGDAIIVFGRPFGTDEAVGYGVVSADEEYVEKADGHYRLICTNITEGENGSGVVLNKKGQVVGLIDQSALGEGSNGRIGGYGISDIKDVIELLSNGSAIPYTGIYGMDVTDKLAKKGMPQGVYVKEVAPDSPAMEAGIQSGDVIIGIDGENIVSLSNYHSILMRREEGSEIELQGCRQGPKDEYVDINFNVTVSTRNKK
ncbi:MAG: S1C family serine protease [Lachnospiraceae bacterium]